MTTQDIINKHLPLCVNVETPSTFKTSAGYNISVAWFDGRLDNPYADAEAMASYIVTATNMHGDLRNTLQECTLWLQSALECKTWVWDQDQRAYAEEAVNKANVLLSRAKGEQP